MKKIACFSAIACSLGGSAIFLSAPLALAHQAEIEQHSLQNISDLRELLIRYHDSGQYQKNFDAVVHKAQKYLVKEANASVRQAIVLDIDETILSNWPAMKANQLAFFMKGNCDYLPEGPCGEAGWMQREEAKAFASSRELIEQAQKRNIAVFLLTGRSEKYRNHVIRNLHKENIHNWTALYMRPVGDGRSAAHYKPPIRASIEAKGYQILLNMGDQSTDLVGGHSKKTFLLPNPFYRVP